MRSPLLRALVMCAVIAVLLPGCAEEERPAQVSRTLPNGVRLLVRENRASNLVAVQAWVADGALYETPSEAGSAYMLSQMMFTRTPERGTGEISRVVEELGGSVTVNCRHDFTQYSAVAPSKHFDVLVDLLSDGLVNAVFDSVHFEKARTGALEAVESIDSRPMEMAHLLCIGSMFGDHPYGRPNQGTPESIRALRLNQVRSRYRDRYVGSNLLISVAGAVDPSEAADELEARLSGIERGRSAEPAAPPIEWPTTPLRTVREGDVRIGYQVMCFPAPGITDEDSITMDVLLMILTGGRSSRLDRILAEETRLVTAVEAAWYTLRQPSPLYVWMELSPGNAEEAEQAVVDLFQEFAATEVSEQELEKAKMYWKTQVLFMNETAEGQAFYDGYWTFLGWPDLPVEYLESIEDVTAEDVRNAARLYFGPGRYATSLLVPEWAQD